MMVMMMYNISYNLGYKTRSSTLELRKSYIYIKICFTNKSTEIFFHESISRCVLENILESIESKTNSTEFIQGIDSKEIFSIFMIYFRNENKIGEDVL